MRKKLFSVLSSVVMMAFAVTAVTITSCVEDNGNVEPAPIQEGDYYLIAQADVKDAKGNAIADGLLIQYASVGPDMKTLQWMSGLITLPKDPKELVGIVLDNHYTISSNDECPSLSLGEPVAPLIGGQFCVVASDYIGYGATAAESHPYLCHELCARNSIDLAKIAVNILTMNGITGLKLFNTGYSQGAGVAMAVHREMEKNPTLAKKLGFYGSWCGDGPYDVEATTKYYLDNADAVSYPVALPLLVEGFLAAAPTSMKSNLKFSDFFTDKMISAGLEKWMRERKLTSTEINKKMADVVGGGTLKVSDIFSPEMAVENGPLMQTYLQFAKMNNVAAGWYPTQYPIRLFHMESDNVVPVINTQNAVENLGLDEKAVTYSELPLSHADFGPAFYVTVFAEVVEALMAGNK